ADERQKLAFGQCSIARPTRHGEEREVIAQSARMREQLSKGDDRTERRHFGYPFLNRIVERELAVDGQQNDAHRRELLGYGCDIESRVRRDGDVVLEVRHAVTLSEHEGAGSRYVGGAAA